MAYGVFAEFYDGLTQNVDYCQKADFLVELFKKYSHKPECVLDLACGTGTLTLEMKKRGFDIFGADGSFEMLAQAKRKADEEQLDVMFLCQKMQSLELYGMIDTCICTLDSISHLQGKKQVTEAFDRVSHFMEDGGLFVFDVNTIYKHREILGNNTFVYDTDDVFCVWQNTFNEKENSVKIELDFFIPEENVYVRSSESFKEYAYSADDITEMLARCGFKVEAIFDEMTFEHPHEKSQRLTFVGRKAENAPGDRV